MDWGVGKLHPVVLLCTLGTWLFAMFFYAQSGYALLFFSVNLLWYFWRLGRSGAAALKWYLFLAGMTVLFNIFFYGRGRHILGYFLGRPILWESVVYGLSMGGLLFSILLFWQVAAVVFPRHKRLWLWRGMVPQTAMVFLFSGGIFARGKHYLEEKWRIFMRQPAEKQSLSDRCRAVGDCLYAFAGRSIQWGGDMVDSVNSRGYGLSVKRERGQYPFSSRDMLLLVYGALLLFVLWWYSQGSEELFVGGMVIPLIYWEWKEGRIWRHYTR